MPIIKLGSMIEVVEADEDKPLFFIAMITIGSQGS